MYMKILITEDRVDKLKGMIKSVGLLNTSKIMGGFDNLCKILNIETPMDFLHLFDDLDIVQSDEKEYFTLFRYKKGNNLMIYNRKSKDVYINYDEIWSFLESKFGLKDSETQRITQKWLGEVYNLRGITTTISMWVIT